MTDSDLFLDYLPDAIAAVDTWDIDDDSYFEAVNQMAHLMAGNLSFDTIPSSLSN